MPKFKITYYDFQMVHQDQLPDPEPLGKAYQCGHASEKEACPSLLENRVSALIP
jgi:hypothetical protein